MANRNGHAEVRLNGGVNNSCFVCRKACNNTCGRCGQFYCSKECQTKDWRDHRFVCFAMPELIMNSPSPRGQRNENTSRVRNDNRNVARNRVTNNRSEEQIPSAESESTPKKTFNYGDEPKNNDEVTITWVKFANHYYIRKVSSMGDYQKNATDFDDYGKNGMRLTALPHRNDMVLVPYDGMFVRAVVLTAESDNKVEVALVDIGRTFSTTMRHMRQLSDDDLRNRKRYNFICTIEHIPNRMDRDSYANLLSFARNQTVFTLHFDGSDYESATNLKLLKKDSGLPIEVAVKSEMENGAARNTENGAPRNTRNGAERTTRNGGARNTENGAESNAEVVTEIGAGSNTEGETENGAASNAEVATEIGAGSNAEAENGAASNAEGETSNETGNNVVSPQKFFMRDLTFEDPPAVADLVILDNSAITTEGRVSAIPNDNIEKMVKLHEKADEYGNSTDDQYNPEPQELCLVKSGGEWYRALYCQPQYRLIDYGLLEDIDERDVRKIPAELADRCYTFFCNVEGFSSSESNLKRYEDALKVNSTHFNCTCKRIDGEPNGCNVKFPLIKEEKK